jgi:hypothetical protein
MVRENHPDKPYDDELGCACGEGMPCECNDSDPPDTSHVIVIGEETVTLAFSGNKAPLCGWMHRNACRAMDQPIWDRDGLMVLPFGPLWPCGAVLWARTLAARTLFFPHPPSKPEDEWSTLPSGINDGRAVSRYLKAPLDSRALDWACGAQRIRAAPT